MKKRLMMIATFVLVICNLLKAEDKVTISDFKISAGETKEVSVTLNNDAAYVAFQFDLYLPNGITIEAYSADRSRMPESTTLDMSKQSDGSYRFLSAAMGGEQITGKSGSIVTLTVKASEGLASGEVNGYFRKVKLSKADATGPTYAEMSFPITIVEPSVVTVTSVSRKYGDANPTFEYTVTGGTLEGTPDITCEATPSSPVGEYPISIAKGSVTNYKVTFVKGTLTITKAPLSIKAGTYTKKQGENNPEFTLSYEGFKNNETETVLTKKPTVTCEATKESNPGEYAVKVSGAEAQNYDISYVDGKLTVTNADPITITAKSYTRVYGDANPVFEFTSSGTALTGTPQISCEATATSPVGTYDIIVSKGSVTNYNVTYVKGTLTITKAPLTITAKSYTIKQGDALPSFEANFSGFKNAETSSVLTVQPTFTCSATTSSVPGTYDITVSNAEATNYNISYVKGTLTVTPGTYTLTYMVDGEVYKTISYDYGATITPEAAPTKEGYTFSGWSEIPTTMPAKDVTVTGTFTINTYKLTYYVDGEVYKSYDIQYGATITPEAAPTKEGYSFSGWSNIPATMPARDVTVTGTFTKGAYKLIYMIDGEVYKTISYDYGATITPEAAPTKEGYTFSGWSEIPPTMPANDVTVTGTFTINTYKLTYYVDGVVYKTYDIQYGASITPEAAPTKDGYVFSGWSEIPRTMPAYDVNVTGSFSKGSYKLTYYVDGEVYKTVSYDYGETIIPEAEPTKEGYTFSGWDYIPSTMPAEDVTVTGTFSINTYTLTYVVDGEVYKTYEIEYGATITPEADPTKEGYRFSGWSNIPSKMPAEDVVVVGTFTQEALIKDNVVYEIAGNNVSVTHADNAEGDMKIESSVTIDGRAYNVTAIADGAFKGCTGLASVEIPNTVTTIGKSAFEGCSGLMIIKIGKDIKEIGSKAFANIAAGKARTRAEEVVLKVYCEAEVLPSTAADAFENSPIDKGTLYVADKLVGDYKVVMPWNGFGTIVGLSTGINSVTIDSEGAWIFDMQGNRLDNVRKGVNIIRMKDGKTKKVMVK